jgi:hypothetical protein
MSTYPPFGDYVPDFDGNIMMLNSRGQLEMRVMHVAEAYDHITGRITKEEWERQHTA